LDRFLWFEFLFLEAEVVSEKIDMLIDEESLLMAAYLRDEKQSWIFRIKRA